MSLLRCLTFALACAARAMRHKSILLILALPVLGCGNAAAPPDWPLHPTIWLVNTTSDSVYLRAEGDESIDGPIIAAPQDSAYGTYNAYADSIPVAVRSWTMPTSGYRSAWLFPLRSSAWRAVVYADTVVLARR